MADKEKKPWRDIVECVRDRLAPGEHYEAPEDGLPHIVRSRVRTGYEAAYKGDAWDFSLQIRGPSDHVLKTWVDVLVVGPSDNPVESWLMERTDKAGEWKLRLFEDNPEEAMPANTSLYLNADAAETFQFVFGMMDLEGRIERRLFS